jgi:hypothetical protein
MMPRESMELKPGGPPPAPLTTRQRAILRIIVHEFVQSGRPVGSKTLTERYAIGYSPATIRNEMAELEAAGFIQQLHTSGGRVPTDIGYRYFVHNLMGAVELPQGEQIMIRHQFRDGDGRNRGKCLRGQRAADRGGAAAPPGVDLSTAAGRAVDPGDVREHRSPDDDSLAAGR